MRGGLRPEELVRMLNARGPARVLERLFGVKAGQGPVVVSRELVPTFEASIQDPEWRRFYGVIAFAGSVVAPAVAARNSSIKVFPLTGYTVVIAKLQCVTVGSSITWGIGAYAQANVLAMPLFNLDSRLGGTDGTAQVTQGVGVNTGDSAGVPSNVIKRAPSTATFGGNITDREYYILEGNEAPSASLNCAADTVNLAATFNVVGYLVPIKAP